MLQLFIELAKRLQDANLDDVTVTLTESDPSDNCSARIDIDAPLVIARITCWETGDYVAEVIDLATEKTIYSSQGLLQKDEIMEDHFSSFFKSIDSKLNL